jgi:acid phosphatase family membrane protein YuiD
MVFNMSYVKQLLENHVFTCAVLGWLSAQAMKTIIVFISTKKFKAERLFGAGGMPSAHSATVVALTVATSRVNGLGSTAFAFSFVLSAIVIYDAMGVRRAAGEHAKAINKIFRINNNDSNPENDIEDATELKEMLGHTPIEVLGGVLLGILIAMLVPYNP